MATPATQPARKRRRPDDRRPSDPVQAARNIALWRAWRAAADEHGDDSPEARDGMTALVEANRGLVWRIALWYANARRIRGDDARIADIISEGTIGFMRAVTKFDPDNEAGASLAHYARAWVSQWIRRWLLGDTLIHIPVYLSDCRATPRAIALYGGAAKAARKVIEFGVISDGGEGDSAINNMISDALVDGDGAYRAERAELDEQHRATVAELMSCLTEKEREVLSLRYGLGGREPITQREIGEHFGKSRGFAGVVEAGAFRKMRRLAEVRGMSIGDPVPVVLRPLRTAVDGRAGR